LAPGSGRERKSGEGRGISGLMPTSGHSRVNRCTALSHEWRLESGWDYCGVVAPLWSDTLNFLAHTEREEEG